MMSRVTAHPSYHGILTQQEAEDKLRRHSLSHRRYYLTRWGESSMYKVSVVTRVRGQDEEHKFQHFNLVFETDKNVCGLGGSSNRFDDIFKVLFYHQSNPVGDELDSIGECFHTLKRSASSPMLTRNQLSRSTPHYPERLHSRDDVSYKLNKSTDHEGQY